MTKNATVSARIDEDVKTKAESILHDLGIPVSVVINTLYHQIIARNGIPFTLTLPNRSAALEDLSDSEFNRKLEQSYHHFLSHEGQPIDEAFDEIERSILQ